MYDVDVNSLTDVELRLERVHTVLMPAAESEMMKDEDRDIIARVCPNANIIMEHSKEFDEILNEMILARLRYLKCNSDFRAYVLKHIFY